MQPHAIDEIATVGGSTIGVFANERRDKAGLTCTVRAQSLRAGETLQLKWPRLVLRDGTTEATKYEPRFGRNVRGVFEWHKLQELAEVYGSMRLSAAAPEHTFTWDFRAKSKSKGEKTIYCLKIEADDVPPVCTIPVKLRTKETPNKPAPGLPVPALPVPESAVPESAVPESAYSPSLCFVLERSSSRRVVAGQLRKREKDFFNLGMVNFTPIWNDDSGVLRLVILLKASVADSNLSELVQLVRDVFPDAKLEYQGSRSRSDVAVTPLSALQHAPPRLPSWQSTASAAKRVKVSPPITPLGES